ncbi:MAG: alpha/beta fold hydrolase [Chitinophagaceae bacterium]|nr:alpha/beta fold hydrolase [Chitinophagaceae bacterium]
MKILLSAFFLLFAALDIQSQSLYIKTFGRSTDKPVIYLHGGPGYNCVNFEATTAQLLANQGFFVIVYDRRGEGRSIDPSAKFTFQQTFDDLNEILKTYQIKKCHLIGHSFGGIVATLYAEAFPDKIQSIFLVGAPVSLQTSFKHIRATCMKIYQDKNDSINLKYIHMLAKMDTNSLEYSSYCFMHAMQNGFYTPKNPTPAAKVVYSRFKTDTLLTKHAAKMTYEGPQGFWKNEHYTTIDLTEKLKGLIRDQIKIYGLYGKEDGLYAAQQINDLQKIIGLQNLKYFDNCSHNVFVDQQEDFLKTMIDWTPGRK